MTTEEDFQAALDADPDDWQTRLVFADWLQDHSDPRAEGYRALGLLRKTPLYRNDDYRAWWYCVYSPRGQRNILEGEWWMAWRKIVGFDREVFYIDTRREAEDAAALAFIGLREAVRRTLLREQVSA